MPSPYINDDTPPGIKFHATPVNAVVGTLRSDASVQEVAEALNEAGIAPATVHFLTGAEGVAFLDRLGNWFTRALSEGLADARGSLESGATMVGVFEVADPDTEAIQRTLFDARVESLHTPRLLDLYLIRHVADRRRTERVREPGRGVVSDDVCDYPREESMREVGRNRLVARGEAVESLGAPRSLLISPRRRTGIEPAWELSPPHRF
jgi:hypothetical protein